MSIESRGASVIFLMSAAGLWALFAWLYRDYRVDLFRFRLFALRDELFDTACAGSLSFSDPAYQTTRSLLNGFIRFADRLGLLTLILNRTYSSSQHLKQLGVADFSMTWDAQVATVSPEAKARLTSIVNRVHQEVIEQLVMTSAVLLVTVIPLVVVLAVRSFGAEVVDWVRRSSLWHAIRLALLNPLDSAAMVLGSSYQQVLR